MSPEICLSQRSSSRVDISIFQNDDVNFLLIVECACSGVVNGSARSVCAQSSETLDKADKQSHKNSLLLFNTRTSTNILHPKRPNRQGEIEVQETATCLFM